MSPAPLEKIVIRYGSLTGRNLEKPKVVELTQPNITRTGILLKSGHQLANYIIPIKAPDLHSGVPLGEIKYLDNKLFYTSFSTDIGNILKRTQFDLDIIPDIADDEYAPKIENMQEHILNASTPYQMRRGDIILARAFNETINTITGTYIELYQVIRDGVSSKL